MSILRSSRAAIFVFALGAGTLLSGCGGDDRPGAGDVSEGDVPAGQTVTVTGEVERLYDERTFTLSGDNEILKPDLAIVSRSPLPAGVAEDTDLKVTGTVRKIGVVEVERELGWDLQQEVEVELEGIKSYLVADTVEIVQE